MGRRSSLVPEAAAALVVLLALVDGSLGFEVSANKINSSAYSRVDPPPFAVACLHREFHAAINASATIHLRAALQSSSHPLQLLRHLFNSEPPIGSGGAALVPAGDDFNNIFGLPVKLRLDVALNHLKPSRSEALPHRSQASVTPLEITAGDLLFGVGYGSVLFEDFDVIGSSLGAFL